MNSNDPLTLPTITTKSLTTSIVTSLQYMISLGLPATLHKIRGRTNIRGKDLADDAAKRAGISFEDIPAHEKVTVNIGYHAERPEFWVMYTGKPPTPPST